MSLTITEALAEIKTIGKRMEKKREGILPFLARQDGVRDPLEKEGGSMAFVASERQGLADLGARIVALRRGIQHANDVTTITIGGVTRSISEWLTWRREVAPGEQTFFTRLRGGINALREKAHKDRVSLIAPGGVATNPADFVISFSESELAAQIEALEETLGALDGQLSLKNATTIIEE